MAFEKKWDWESIRMDYMIGEIYINKSGLETHRPFTIARLSEKHGIPNPTIAERCKKEKWVHQRNLLDSQLKRRMTEGKVTSILGEASMFDNLALAQLGKTSELVNAYFKQYTDVLARDINTYELESEVYEPPKINTRDLKDIVGVIKEIHTLSKVIMGTDTLQDKLEEIQNKNKTKQFKPTEMNDRIKKLLEERQRMQSMMNQEKRAIEEVNIFNVKTITEIES